MSDIHTIGHQATGIRKQPGEYILADSKTSCTYHRISQWSSWSSTVSGNSLWKSWSFFEAV